MERIQRLVPASDGGYDLIRVLGPAEGAWVGVGVGDIAIDGFLERDEGVEHAALEPLPGELGEEALDRVDQRGRGRREVEREAGIPDEPLDHRQVLVSGIVVQDQADQLGRCYFALDVVEEADKLLMPVALHAAPDHAAFQIVVIHYHA